jgi:hypothetical protein
MRQGLTRSFAEPAPVGANDLSKTKDSTDRRIAGWQTGMLNHFHRGIISLTYDHFQMGILVHPPSPSIAEHRGITASSEVGV